MPLETFPTPEILLVTQDNLAHAIERIRFESKALGLDTETTGLDPLLSEVRIRLLQIAVTCATDPVLVFDLFALGEEVLAPLWDLLMDPHGPPVCMHNAAFDCGQLWCIGVEIPASRVRCTMLQERALTCGQQQARLKGGKAAADFFDVIESGEDPKFEDLPCSLEATVARRLKLSLAKDEQKSDWGAPELTRAQLVYAAADPKATLAVHRIQESLLRFDAGLRATVELENRLVNSVVWMQLSGMPVSKEHWENLTETLTQEQVEHEQAFVTALDDALVASGQKGLPRDLFGCIDVSQVKLRHAPTLTGHLNRLGFQLPDLNKQTVSLAEIDHPVMDAFVTWRKGESLLRYAKAFVKQIRPTGRVHCSIQIWRAATGRLAAKAPNLMNIPRDGRYRAGFRAADGWKIIGADYSQIEPRLMAAISGDAALSEVFIAGKDVYKATAALTAGIPLEEVDKQGRQNGKIAVLALMYGMGWQKFQRYAWTQFRVRKSDAEAQFERAAFFRAFPGVAKYHSDCAEQLDDKGKTVLESRSLLGRRRFLEGKDRSYSTLINNKIQATAADAMKIALADLPDALWTSGCTETRLICVVHDEVLLESPDFEVEKASRVLEQVMTAAAARFLGDIPACVDAIAGQSWAEAKG
jgi:DNA polymerase-1